MSYFKPKIRITNDVTQEQLLEIIEIIELTQDPPSKNCVQHHYHEHGDYVVDIRVRDCQNIELIIVTVKEEIE